MTQQHNYEHTVTFSFLIFFVESEENKEKETEFVVLLFWEKVLFVIRRYLLGRSIMV